MSNIWSRLRWPTSLWAPHMASSLYSCGVTSCNSLWSHLAWLIHWYRTPSYRHSFSLWFRYCFSSCNICSCIFTASNFLFFIQVTTWLMVRSALSAWTQSATVIHIGGDSKIRELIAFSWQVSVSIRASGPSTVVLRMASTTSALILWSNGILDNASPSALDLPNQ